VRVRFSDDFDKQKSVRTKQERGIDFIEIRMIWNDPDSVDENARNTTDEERKFTVGKIGEKLWVAIWTYRNRDEIRIISVRRAEGTNFERTYYESK